MEGVEVYLHIFSDLALYGRKSSYKIYEGIYGEDIVPNAHATDVDFSSILD
jgi:hypothetical protein